jgi:precorrin-6Y C5,15-methyltransferase (decarboxylating)
MTGASRAALDTAEIIFGGPRHLGLVGAGARGRPWPVPFDLAPLLALRGQRVAVLASGDPFWYGAGGSLAQALSLQEWRAYPGISVFSHGAALLGWRLEELCCLGLHAAPLARLRPHLQPDARLICTLRDGAHVAELATWLCTQGMGDVRLWVMEALGGPRQRLREVLAAAYDLGDVGPLVAVALQIPGGAPALSLAPGREDAIFVSDGQITKSPVRAVTLAALAPRAGEMLWDLGSGSGSVSVEWCLAGGRAVAQEVRADRLSNIQKNIDNFGLAGQMQPRLGALPGALPDERPDAVFVGGGFSAPLMARLLEVAKGARLVVNGVTLETEALLAELHAQHGGRLMRMDFAVAQALGSRRGWAAARPVVQWSVTL